jgi:hypothetical protein
MLKFFLISTFRMILSEVDDATMAKLEETKTVAAEKSQMRELNLTTWYHEGPDELIPAREFIRDYRYDLRANAICLFNLSSVYREDESGCASLENTGICRKLRNSRVYNCHTSRRALCK